MLQNIRVTAFTVSELLRENHQDLAYFFYKKHTTNTTEKLFLAKFVSFHIINISFSPSYWNSGSVPSKVSLAWRGEGTPLALFGHPSSGGVTIEIPYGVNVLLHQPASHPSFLLGSLKLSGFIVRSVEADVGR